MPDAVDTVVCAPNDGWIYHPKHVEQFPEINKLCNVASYWIYIYMNIFKMHGPLKFKNSLTSSLDGVGDQRHAPAALPPEKTR